MQSVGASIRAIKAMKETPVQFTAESAAPGHSIYACTWDSSGLSCGGAALGWQQVWGFSPGFQVVMAGRGGTGWGTGVLKGRAVQLAAPIR